MRNYHNGCGRHPTQEEVYRIIDNIPIRHQRNDQAKN